MAARRSRDGGRMSLLSRQARRRVPFLDTVKCGDSAQMLRSFPGNSVDLVITSPPYFQQRAYGWGGAGEEKRVDGYIDAVMEVFRQCVRIAKDTGSIVFNMGDKYLNGSLALVPYRFAIEATDGGGVKLVNDITWVKSNPTPRQFQRRLVSSTEPFFHFVKSDGYFYNIGAFKGGGRARRQAAQKHDDRGPVQGSRQKVGSDAAPEAARSGRAC